MRNDKPSLPYSWRQRIRVARGDAPLCIVYTTGATAESAVKVAGVFPEDSHPADCLPDRIDGPRQRSGHPIRQFPRVNGGDAGVREAGFCGSALSLETSMGEGENELPGAAASKQRRRAIRDKQTAAISAASSNDERRDAPWSRGGPACGGRCSCVRA